MRFKRTPLWAEFWFGALFPVAFLVLCGCGKEPTCKIADMDVFEGGGIIGDVIPADRGHMSFFFLNSEIMGMCELGSQKILWNQRPEGPFEFRALSNHTGTGRVAVLLLERYQRPRGTWRLPVPGQISMEWASEPMRPEESRIWIMRGGTGQVLGKFPGPSMYEVVSPTQWIQWSPEGDVLFVLHTPYLSAWHVGRQERLWQAELPSFRGRVWPEWMEWFDGRTLLVWQQLGYSLWDSSTRELRHKGEHPRQLWGGGAALADGAVYATSVTRDPPCPLWRLDLDGEAREQVCTIPTNHARSLALSPGRGLLAVDGHDDLFGTEHSIHIYSIVEEAKLDYVARIGGLDWSCSFTWTPDGKLAVVDGGRITIIEIVR